MTASIQTLEHLQSLLLQHLVRELSTGAPSAAILECARKTLSDSSDAIAAANVAKRRELEGAYAGGTLPFATDGEL
jgi:hypothetical protein